MKKVGRKAASILLTLCMLLTMLPISALAADPGEEGTAENPPVTYLDENKEARTCTNYTVVTSSDTNWSAGWYVVTGTVNLTGRVSGQRRRTSDPDGRRGAER